MKLSYNSQSLIPHITTASSYAYDRVIVHIPLLPIHVSPQYLMLIAYNRVSWRGHNVKTQQLPFPNYDRRSTWKGRRTKVCFFIISMFSSPSACKTSKLPTKAWPGVCCQEEVELTVCWRPPGGPLSWWRLPQVLMLLLKSFLLLSKWMVLMMIIDSGSRTTAQILLDAGADPDRWNKFGKSLEIDNWGC